MKTFKKALAVVMCVVMTLTAAPLGGLVGLELPNLFDFEAEAASYSGTCGTNLKWSLDTSTGLLVISGTGEMADYYRDSSSQYIESTAPWNDYRNSIKKVIIENGITYIGDYAFFFCSNITELTIPASAKICNSEEVFMGCYFRKITITKGTGVMQNYRTVTDQSSSYEERSKTYYEYTPWYNGGCSTVVIEDGVTNIGTRAFYECEELTNITIPASVKTIDNLAFGSCSNLSNVYYTGDVNEWCSINFISTPMYYSNNLYIGNELVENLVIPDGVTTINSLAFKNCNKLKTVVIPNSVKTIGSNAFDGCNINYLCYSGTNDQWENVSIGSNNLSLDSSTFFFDSIGFKTSEGLLYVIKTDGTAIIVNYSGEATNIIIPTEIDGYKVANIYTGAFASSTSVIAFSVDAANEYFSSDKNGILYSKDKTQIIAYPAGKTDTSIIIPKNVTSFAESAFSGNTKLSDVYYEGTLAEWCSIEFTNGESNPLSVASNFFIDNNLVILLTIPESIEKVGNYAFYGYNSLATITLPESVKTVGSGAFANSATTSVTIGLGLTKIEESAFAGCTGLVDVYYPGTASQFANIEIALGNMELTGSILHFEYQSTNQPTVSGKCGDAVYWSYLDGILTISGKGAMTDFSGINEPWYDYRTSVTDIIIEKGVTTIGVDAFYGHSALKSVSIPNTVTSIGSRAFYNCTAVKSITIPDSVITIGNYAFESCTNLVLELEKDSYAETYANKNNIYYCYIYDGSEDKIVSVPVTSKLSFEINKETYTMTINCSGDMPSFGEGVPWVSYERYIKHIIINDGCTSITDSAFKNMQGIISVIIPDSVISIGNDAFYSCTSLTSVTIGNSVISIGNYVFRNCDSLTSVTIPDSVTNIGENAFYDCGSLTSVTIPNSVTSIGKEVFKYCSNLVLELEKNHMLKHMLRKTIFLIFIFTTVLKIK